MAKARRVRKTRTPAHTATPIPRTHKPDGMTLEEWQSALRRQFGREQRFVWRNVGDHLLFSDFEVANPQRGTTYTVTVRGPALGDNRCTCPDFRVNTLGTCKHIEFVLSRLERRHGKRRLRAAYTPPFSEVYLRYGARRDIVFRPGADCPQGLLDAAREIFDDGNVLRAEGYDGFDRFLEAASGGDHDLRVREDAIAFLAEKRDQEYRQCVIDKEFPAGADSPALAGLLKSDLFHYQREGALFAARSGRCLIGDEMGLGKTIQAIGAAEIMARQFGVERVLVVCPTSLKHQWKHEIERFSDRMADVVEGPIHVRRASLEAESFFKITNYDLIHRDLDQIRRWSPDLVILDEAQRIKNWKTRTAQSVKRLQSQFAIVLTGTPLENRLEELYSIVEFIDRFRLGPMFGFLHRHQVTDEAGKVIGYRDLDQVGRTLAPVLIRRKKEDVAIELPERVDNRFFVPMTAQQMEYHEENREIVARIVAKWRRHRYLSEADQRRLTCALQNMRMSCNSTFLLDNRSDWGHKADEIASLIEEVCEDDGAKVVVFSQWMRMHEVLIRRFQARDWEFVQFHGGIPSARRGALVHRFREDPRCRIFLATDAGGTGLNLQNARAVINVDLPWNPAVLEQRIGRVHRLGQRQPVQAVSFVAQGTIEHGMLSLLEFKTSLFSGVLDGGPHDVFLSGSRLSKFMETVESVTGTIPTPMPDEAPGDAAEAQDETPLPEEPVPAPTPATPWMDAVAAGLMLLKSVGGAMAGDGATSPLVHRDEKTGETFLRIPQLKPETADKVARGLQLLAEVVGDLMSSPKA